MTKLNEPFMNILFANSSFNSFTARCIFRFELCSRIRCLVHSVHSQTKYLVHLVSFLNETPYLCMKVHEYMFKSNELLTVALNYLEFHKLTQNASTFDMLTYISWFESLLQWCQLQTKPPMMVIGVVFSGSNIMIAALSLFAVKICVHLRTHLCVWAFKRVYVCVNATENCTFVRAGFLCLCIGCIMKMCLPIL